MNHIGKCEPPTPIDTTLGGVKWHICASTSTLKLLGLSASGTKLLSLLRDILNTCLHIMGFALDQFLVEYFWKVHLDLWIMSMQNSKLLCAPPPPLFSQPPLDPSELNCNCTAHLILQRNSVTNIAPPINNNAVNNNAPLYASPFRHRLTTRAATRTVQRPPAKCPC